MRRTVAGLCVVLVSLTAVGAASAAIIRIGAQANGKTVGVKQGDLLIVSLVSNHTTGHHWELAGVNLSVLRPETAVYEAAKQKPGKPPVLGAPGTYTLTLSAHARGTTRLELEYVSGVDGKVGQRYRVTIVVA